MKGWEEDKEWLIENWIGFVQVFADSASRYRTPEMEMYLIEWAPSGIWGRVKTWEDADEQKRSMPKRLQHSTIWYVFLEEEETNVPAEYQYCRNFPLYVSLENALIQGLNDGLDQGLEPVQNLTSGEQDEEDAMDDDDEGVSIMSAHSPQSQTVIPMQSSSGTVKHPRPVFRQKKMDDALDLLGAIADQELFWPHVLKLLLESASDFVAASFDHEMPGHQCSFELKWKNMPSPAYLKAARHEITFQNDSPLTLYMAFDCCVVASYQLGRGFSKISKSDVQNWVFDDKKEQLFHKNEPLLSNLSSIKSRRRRAVAAARKESLNQGADHQVAGGDLNAPTVVNQMSAKKPRTTSQSSTLVVHTQFATLVATELRAAMMQENPATKGSAISMARAVHASAARAYGTGLVSFEIVGAKLLKSATVILSSAFWSKCVVMEESTLPASKLYPRGRFSVSGRFRMESFEQLGYDKIERWAIQLCNTVQSNMAVIQKSLPRGTFIDQDKLMEAVAKLLQQVHASSDLKSTSSPFAFRESGRGTAGMVAVGTSNVYRSLSSAIYLIRFVLLRGLDALEVETSNGLTKAGCRAYVDKLLQSLEVHLNMEVKAATMASSSFRRQQTESFLPEAYTLSIRLKAIWIEAVAPLSYCVEYLCVGGSLEDIALRRHLLFADGSLLKELQTLLICCHTLICDMQRPQVWKNMVLLSPSVSTMTDMRRLGFVLVSALTWQKGVPNLLINQDKISSFKDPLSVPLPCMFDLIVALLLQFKEYVCNDMGFVIPPVPLRRARLEKAAEAVQLQLEDNYSKILFPVMLESVVTEVQPQNLNAFWTSDNSSQMASLNVGVSSASIFQVTGWKLIDKNVKLMSNFHDLLKYGPKQKAFWQQLTDHVCKFSGLKIEDQTSLNGSDISSFCYQFQKEDSFSAQSGAGSIAHYVIPRWGFSWRHLRIMLVALKAHQLRDDPVLTAQGAALRRHSDFIAKSQYAPNTENMQAEAAMKNIADKVLGLKIHAWRDNDQELAQLSRILSAENVGWYVADHIKLAVRILVNIVMWDNSVCSIGIGADDTLVGHGEMEEGDSDDGDVVPMDTRPDDPVEERQSKAKEMLETVRLQHHQTVDDWINWMLWVNWDDYYNSTDSGRMYRFPRFCKLGDVHCLLRQSVVVVPKCLCCSQSVYCGKICLSQAFSTDTSILMIREQVISIQSAEAADFLSGCDYPLDFWQCLTFGKDCAKLNRHCSCQNSTVLLLDESIEVRGTANQATKQRLDERLFLK